MSSFFTAPASQRKRKRQDGPRTSSGTKQASGAPREAPRPAAKKPRKELDDESISGSDSDDGVSGATRGPVGSDSSDSEADDTAAERRVKLAARYLENIRAELGNDQEVGFDAEDIDRELIAARLKEDVAEDKGRIYRNIGQGLDVNHAEHSFFRADTLATTGVACCPPYVYTVSKDMSLIKWELPASARSSGAGSTNGHGLPQRRRKPKQLKYTKGNKNRSDDQSYQHHTAAILCVAASASGQFVATGGADKRIIIWDAATLAPLKVFAQHRDSVTALAFRGKTNQMFSASKDRTIKIWSLDELAYVETLFGHQDEVLDVAAVGGKEERCVSVGARDRSARLWKVLEESQLVFRGGGSGGSKQGKPRDGVKARSTDVDAETFHSFAEGSLDRVIQIDTQLFVTGSDSGALSLYGLHKKKPLHVVPTAHGIDPAIQPEESSAEADTSTLTPTGQPTPRWITALASIPFTDLFVSGSWDGTIKLWRVSTDQKHIEAVGCLGQSPTENGSLHVNDTSANMLEGGNTEDQGSAPLKNGSDTFSNLRGIVNDLAIFELEPGPGQRRGKGGICVIAGTGQESRLGRWIKIKGGRNGAAMFTVPSV